MTVTFSFGQGNWKRWTLQKSSATATILSLWERHKALMSVPSEPSNQTPVHTTSREPSSSQSHFKEHLQRNSSAAFSPITWKPSTHVKEAHSLSLLSERFLSSLHPPVMSPVVENIQFVRSHTCDYHTI